VDETAKHRKITLGVSPDATFEFRGDRLLTVSDKFPITSELAATPIYDAARRVPSDPDPCVWDVTIPGYFDSVPMYLAGAGWHRNTDRAGVDLDLAVTLVAL